MRSIIAFLVTILLVSVSGPAGARCTYSVAPDGVKVQWTAFKFTSKQGVSGTFNTMKLSGPMEADTLTSLAEGLSMEIDGKSIESNNPGRNATISEFFFQTFAPSPNITGRVESVEGDDSKGTLKIAITMNGTTRSVPFAYTISDGNAVEAAASIDMLDFALQKSYDSIHLACEEQHTGEDGISKTWTEVDLKLTGTFTSTCG
jgi:polyisoprenoid-binding protein YceI